MMNLVVKALEEMGIVASITTAQMIDGEHKGLSFGTGNVRPTMYFTEEHEKMTSKEIAKWFADKYEHMPKAPEVDASAMMTREYIKSHVHAKLVPASAAYVNDKARKDFLDLVKLYYIDTPIEGGTITLLESHLKHAGITVDELDSWASDAYEVKGMYETLMEMNPQMTEMLGVAPEHEEQLVLSNTKKINGAAAMTDKKILELALDKLGVDTLYILPSSIHEVLAVAAMGDPDELRQLVCEVNDTQVVPKERLSYNVYKYERGGELEIA
jgi:hypothetical protein